MKIPSNAFSNKNTCYYFNIWFINWFRVAFIYCNTQQIDDSLFTGRLRDPTRVYSESAREHTADMGEFVMDIEMTPVKKTAPTQQFVQLSDD